MFSWECFPTGTKLYLLCSIFCSRETEIQNKICWNFYFCLKVFCNVILERERERTLIDNQCYCSHLSRNVSKQKFSFLFFVCFVLFLDLLLLALRFTPRRHCSSEVFVQYVCYVSVVMHRLQSEQWRHNENESEIRIKNSWNNARKK